MRRWSRLGCQAAWRIPRRFRCSRPSALCYGRIGSAISTTCSSCGPTPRLYVTPWDGRRHVSNPGTGCSVTLGTGPWRATGTGSSRNAKAAGLSARSGLLTFVAIPIRRSEVILRWAGSSRVGNRRDHRTRKRRLDQSRGEAWLPRDWRCRLSRRSGARPAPRLTTARPSGHARDLPRPAGQRTRERPRANCDLFGRGASTSLRFVFVHTPIPPHLERAPGCGAG
jgi:hypothetical protein